MIRIRVDSYQNILEKVDSDTITRILSQTDIEKSKRFHFQEDRDRFIAARVLFWLESAHVSELHSDIPLPVSFSYNKYGKPSLEHFPAYFNWSHSGNLIALILGSVPVGIDIEQIPERPLFEYKSLCTSQELIWIHRQISTNKHTEKEAFIVLWSAKEAVLKAIGTGLSTDPRNVAVHMDELHPGEWKCQINQHTLFGSATHFKVANMGYAISWCSTSKDDQPEVIDYISVLSH